MFFTHAREALNYHYERNPADPRVAHSLTLEVDDFGNVLKSAAVGYGRRQPDATLEARRPGQAEPSSHVTYTENAFTNADRRCPTTTARRCRARRASYELTGLALRPGGDRFTFDAGDRRRLGARDDRLRAERRRDGVLQKRLIEHVAHPLSRRRSGAAPLPLGQLRVAGAAVRELQARVHARPGRRRSMAARSTRRDARPTRAATSTARATTSWWIPSGRVFLSPGRDDDAAAELAYARAALLPAAPLPRSVRHTIDGRRPTTPTIC